MRKRMKQQNSGNETVLKWVLGTMEGLTRPSLTRLIRVNIVGNEFSLLIRSVCILSHRSIQGCRNRGRKIAKTNEILSRDAQYVQVFSVQVASCHRLAATILSWFLEWRSSCQFVNTGFYQTKQKYTSHRASSQRLSLGWESIEIKKKQQVNC